MPRKRISKEVITVDEVIKGFLKVGVKVSEEYNFKAYEPLEENLLIIDSGTYSGIEIENIRKDGKKKLKVFSGGLYFETLYGKELGYIEDINDIYNKLVDEDKLNVDIFQMLFICLSDYGIRGKR